MTYPAAALRPWSLALIAGALVAAGAAGTYLLLDGRAGPPPGPAVDADAAMPPDMPDMPGMPAAAGPAALTLTPEAVARAGIRVAAVSPGRAARTILAPGVVEPHGYRTVMVTALTAGQVTAVFAELGDHVEAGEVMAELYSPELAQTQREFIATRADMAAIGQRVARLERLTAIGAASEQELEGAVAEMTRAAADLESARARLSFLGLAAAAIEQLDRANQVTATMPVAAPAAGVVTRRLANQGQTVDPTKELFTVVDLAVVWVVGDVYERDLQHLRLGSEVTITAPSLPGRTWRGRVSYIDPQIAGATRTARVRVEVDNPDDALRLGMFAELAVEEPAGTDVLLVPRSAVQTIGGADVVYVPEPGADGRFVERVVRLGRPAGDAVEVLEGLEAGESVVTAGSFALRAERDRLGLPVPRPWAPVAVADTHRIRITTAGFEPASIRLPAGQPVTLEFTRETDETCATEVVFPALGIRSALPLGEPVTVSIAPQPAGDLTFVCGMNMLRGTLVVERR